MEPVGLTRAMVAAPVLACLERAGAPVEAALARAGLPAWALAEPEGLVSTSSIARLLAGASGRRLPSAGLAAGRLAARGGFGTYGRLLRRARTLGEAIETAVREHPAVCSGARLWTVARDDAVEVRHAFTHGFDERDDGWREATYYVLSLLLEAIRLVVGPTWRPGEVVVQGSGSPALDAIRSSSGAHPAPGQPGTAVVVPRALLDAPLPRAVADAGETDVRTWRASAPASDFVGSIVQILDTLSSDGYPDVHLTAAAVGVSVRSLQRRLAEAGVSHASLIERLRFAAAAELLGATDSRIIDVALDLGYSDHAHFTRAFRRWAACSPQEFRRRWREGSLCA